MERAMSITLDFEVRLSRQRGEGGADVRIWVDADGNQQLDNGEEVRPIRRDGLVFRGGRSLDLADIEGVGFLARLQVSPGTRYLLRAYCNDGERRRLVFEEQDVAATSSHRVIGWCRA
jgi:hypothetical protein